MRRLLLADDDQDIAVEKPKPLLEHSEMSTVLQLCGTAWIFQDMIYVTDKVIALRVEPRYKLLFRKTTERLKRIARQIDELILQWNIEFTERGGLYEYPPCTECDDFGTIALKDKKCPACNGKTRVECYDCGADDRCSTCRGSGRLLENAPCDCQKNEGMINRVTFGRRYLSLMNRLVLRCDRKPGWLRLSGPQAIFTFPTGVGLLMGIENHADSSDDV